MAQEAGDDFFLFDIGDHADRWHPLTEATNGQENVQFIKRIGCSCCYDWK